MKKFITSIFLAATAAIALVSCTEKQVVSGMGTLSFDNFVVECDDYVETKAVSPASGNYSILVYNADGDLVLKTNYAAIKNSAQNSVPLPAGEYTLEARSSEDEVAAAEFEQPVYGAKTSFSITAGSTTTLPNIVCSLLQVKVTVDYSDDFLAMVTGNGATSVEVTSGYPLNYELTCNSGSVSYEQAAGYFAVNGGAATTMAVTFKGIIDGKSQKMSKTFTGIAPKQWRQIKFIKKIDEEGNATFDVVINNMVNDEVLNNVIPGSEDIMGEDPAAPKGDGGITLEFDYAAGCDADIVDFNNILMPQPSERTVTLKLLATVPNGVKKFTVDIASSNEAFLMAVQAADALHLDLINPTADNAIIFDVVPFPHGTDLLGQTILPFDLSAAQDAITMYQGVHTFTMNVVDNKGCKNSFPVTMIVE